MRTNRRPVPVVFGGTALERDRRSSLQPCPQACVRDLVAYAHEASTPPTTMRRFLMNKGEMAAKLATKTGLSKAKSLEVINAIFSAEKGEGIIAVELDGGRKVVIPG